MFGKTTIIATTLALAAATLAQPMLHCSSGYPLCCEAVKEAKGFGHGMMSPPGMPGFGHPMPDGLVGFACKPMDDMKCYSHAPPLCCEMNNFGGIIAFGCMPAKPDY